MKKVLRQCIILGCFLFLVTGCGKKDVTLEQYFNAELALKDLPEPTDKTDNSIKCEMNFIGQEGLASFWVEDGGIEGIIDYATEFDEQSKYKNCNDFISQLKTYLEKSFGEKGNNSLEIEEKESDGTLKFCFMDKNKNEISMDCILSEKYCLIYFNLD